MHTYDIAAGCDEVMPGRVAAIVRDQKRIGSGVGKCNLLCAQPRDDSRDASTIKRGRLNLAMETHEMPLS